MQRRELRTAAGLLALVGLLGLAGDRPALALETGAPLRTCATLRPVHGDSAPQRGPSHFALTATGGGARRAVNVTIASRHGFSFRGFVLQAREPDSAAPLGSFTVLDTAEAQTLDCPGGEANTVTHRDAKTKNSTTFVWTPPADFQGPVDFNATVLQDFTTYWVGLTARAVVGGGGGGGISTTRDPVTTMRTSTTASPRPALPTRANLVEDPVFNGCAASKLCFGDTAGCEANRACTYMVTAKQRDNMFEFELMTSDTDANYIAVGMSNTNSMDNAPVMECVLMNGVINVFDSWNVRRGNRRLDRKQSSLLNSSNADGRIYCHFSRPANTTVEDTELNLLDTKYYIILAIGNTKTEDGISYHSKRAITANKMSLNDYSEIKHATNLFVHLHGAFMIGAWIGAASIGIVLARYFKQTWTGSQLCGKDQWFAWHRIFMSLVWLLTIAAFILIFVELKAWSTQDKHAILGVITTALAFFQPIGAIFRPSPDSRRRPIFNWVHWFAGNSAHIFGIVTIFLAGQLAKAELPSWWIWIMVGFVAFHVIMHLLFSVTSCISERHSNKRINSFPMKEMSNSRTPLSTADRKQEASLSCFRKFLLALYIFGILVITIALILIVVLAPIEDYFKK